MIFIKYNNLVYCLYVFSAFLYTTLFNIFFQLCLICFFLIFFHFFSSKCSYFFFNIIKYIFKFLLFSKYIKQFVSIFLLLVLFYLQVFVMPIIVKNNLNVFFFYFKLFLFLVNKYDFIIF